MTPKPKLRTLEDMKYGYLNMVGTGYAVDVKMIRQAAQEWVEQMDEDYEKNDFDLLVAKYGKDLAYVIEDNIEPIRRWVWHFFNLK